MEVAPIVTHCCHCRLCQLASGSAFRVNAMIETEHLTLLAGEPQPFQGTNSQKVLRCPACGFNLWSHHPALGDAIAMVGVGTLDQGERLPPEVHYFIRSKHPWVTLPPTSPPSRAGRPRKPARSASGRAGEKWPGHSLAAWTGARGGRQVAVASAGDVGRGADGWGS
jgi:hypothetical protein